MTKPLVRATVRITAEIRAELEALIFKRYPRREWATFIRFGFRDLGDRVLITIVDLIAPEAQDLNGANPNVEFTEPYILRTALGIRRSPLCVGVVHSHPENFGTAPSPTDDDMDGYFGAYFGDFTKEPAYTSLIFAKSKSGAVAFSGRGEANGKAFTVDKIVTVSNDGVDAELHPMLLRPMLKPFNARLGSIFGEEARRKLAVSSVAIVGVGGSGSAVAHLLTRAGISDFVIVDPEAVEDSNFERLHGMLPAHAGQNPLPYKVAVVRDLIKAINPQARVVPVVGNILQELAKDSVLGCDLIINSTDSNHSRAAGSELAYRYLVPVLDIGVSLDGSGGKVTAEVAQFTKYGPSLPCAYCRSLVDPRRMQLELLSEAEREERKRQAARAKERGEDANQYWVDLPQLHTVGHLTTLAASLVAAYAIGCLTGKFHAPANHFQFDILARDFGFVSVDVDKKGRCACAEAIGYADQGRDRTTVTAPSHFRPAEILK